MTIKTKLRRETRKKRKSGVLESKKYINGNKKGQERSAKRGQEIWSSILEKAKVYSFVLEGLSKQLISQLLLAPFSLMCLLAQITL